MLRGSWQKWFVHLDAVTRDWLALFALIALALSLLQRAWQRWSARRRVQRRMQRARVAEASAGQWLRERGYSVAAAQVAGSYALCVDGEDVTIQVRADYVVERDGARYVAEVKSGQTAPSLQTRATRRQLLEYRMAFDVDGVLLVDAETERVHEVSFPISWPRALPQARWPWALIALLFAGLGALLARLH